MIVIAVTEIDTDVQATRWRARSLLAGAGWLVVVVAGALWTASIASAEPVWHAAVIALVVLTPATVGAVLAARVGVPVGWLLLGSSAATAVAGAAGHVAENQPSAPAAVWGAWVAAVLWAFGPPLLPLMALVFPDGRELGHLGTWGLRAGIAGVTLVALASAFMPGPLAGLSDTPGPANPLGVPALRSLQPVLLSGTALLLLVAAVLALLTLGRRWRRGRRSDRLALAAAGTPLAVAIALALAVHAVGVGGEGVALVGALVAALGMPAGLWLAVTRYRLYELDLLVARTLAYAATVAGLALLFVVVAAVVGLLIGGHSRVAVAAAAAITATAAGSVRTRVVGHVQRSVLGLAGDPKRAAELVEQRLATVRDPDLIPEAAAQAVTDALRLPGVRVVLPDFPDDPAAEPGVTLPLSHHGIRLGALTAPRPVSTAERRALVVVAVPVAAGLHSASLSRAVRQSRAELLAAVEEERRRLRRDLHDGLGPKLAILAMGLDAAQNLAAGTPAETSLAAVFDRLRGQADAMLGSLRHIVSGLRPPALDECGLAEALRRYASEVAEPAGLSVELDSDELGPLTAAVEVAAYRIAVEAVLNAARHSRGQHCRLVLRRQDGLRLSVTDDGRGIPELVPTGVGTQSMRERAAALGGWVAIGPADRCGTEVRAWLPGVPT